MIVLSSGAAFYHLPKTGGTWIERVAEERGCVRERYGQHDPAWARPGGTTRFGTTRDPWSWYASLYRHAQHVCEPAGTALREYGGGSDAFADVLAGLTGIRARRSEACVGVIWHPTREGAAAFHRSGVGLWTWAHRYVYGTQSLWNARTGAWAVDALLDQGQLAEAARAALGLDGEGVPPALAYRGTPHADLYTGALLRCVEAADGELAAALGYTEPFRPAKTAVIPLGVARR